MSMSVLPAYLRVYVTAPSVITHAPPRTHTAKYACSGCVSGGSVYTYRLLPRLTARHTLTCLTARHTLTCLQRYIH